MQEFIKYLGTMVDAKLSFKQHLRNARDVEIGTWPYTYKLFIAKVMSSTLFYAAAA